MAKSGRPAFEPTEFQRGQVHELVVCGIEENAIAGRLGISKATLQKYFRDVIDLARTSAHVDMGMFIYNSALGRGDKATRLTDERARATLAVFYAKTQMRWRETVQHEGVKAGEPIVIKISKDDAKL